MGRSYRNGLQSALRHWRLVVMVFTANLLGGCIFMGCAWVWLASALDSSLATRTLATSLDVNVFVDLAANHGASLRMFLFLALVLTVGGSVLWIGVNAVVIAMANGRQSSIAAAARIAVESFFAFAKLWTTATAAHAVAIGGAYLGCRILLRLTAGNPSQTTYYGIIAASVVLCLVAVLVITTIHDHARIRCLETGDPALAAGIWACGYVARERRALPLTLMLVCTTAAGWVVYQVASGFVGGDSTMGLSISLVAAQAFMAFRAFVRVWAFTATTELQSGWESA